MDLPYSYCVFCDSNNLKRIDATAEDHLRNLDLMAVAVLEERMKYLKQITERCPQCSGSGKRVV